MDVFHANSGQILIDGKPFRAERHKIGYLPEERGLYPKRTVTDQMVFLARLRGMKKADALKSAAKWLERLGISEYAGRKLETLSKGNQQKGAACRNTDSRPRNCYTGRAVFRA